MSTTSGKTSSKTTAGNFFEDFSVGQVIRHAVPRTVGEGERALYTGLYGMRCAVQSSDAFARAIGYQEFPVDDMLVFHIVFGKTVPDISLNAVANLGYADCRFLKPVFAGDTLHSQSEVIGVKQNSNGKTGVVYVRSTGMNQHGEPVLEFVRWVMVRKRDAALPAPDPVVPELPDHVSPAHLGAACPVIDPAKWDTGLSGSAYLWDDYQAGERIDHVDGMTVEEAEHMLATQTVPEHRESAFQPVHRGSGPVWPPADLWRPCDFAGPCPVVQRTGQRVPYRSHQRRCARGAPVRR